LVSLTNESVPEEYAMIRQNDEHLTKAGENYPNINSPEQYGKYLLSIYGEFDVIALKRFRIFYKGAPCGQIGLHSFIIRNL
jgi:intein/homing endonuclease